MLKIKNHRIKLLVVKILHTFIWIFFVLAIFYIMYSGILNRINLFTWAAITLVLIEGIVLFINGWRCPITKIGEKYTDEADVGFDIFLPRWLAKHNKVIFTTVYAIGIIIVIYRLLSRL
jgi:hypothetical protein